MSFVKEVKDIYHGIEAELPEGGLGELKLELAHAALEKIKGETYTAQHWGAYVRAFKAIAAIAKVIRAVRKK